VTEAAPEAAPAAAATAEETAEETAEADSLAFGLGFGILRPKEPGASYVMKPKLKCSGGLPSRFFFFEVTFFFSRSRRGGQRSTVSKEGSGLAPAG